ncbi:hypothetical protein JK211_14395 [Tatumella sp. JGM130]|nr:hypothetical protein [Tatumella sp. JGM130]
MEKYNVYELKKSDVVEHYYDAYSEVIYNAITDNGFIATAKDIIDDDQFQSITSYYDSVNEFHLYDVLSYLINRNSFDIEEFEGKANEEEYSYFLNDVYVKGDFSLSKNDLVKIQCDIFSERISDLEEGGYLEEYYNEDRLIIDKLREVSNFDFFISKKENELIRKDLSIESNSVSNRKKRM